MAFEANLETLPGLVASGDLSSTQFRAVEFATTAGAVIQVNDTSALAIGVLQNDPTDGVEALVAYHGVSKWEAATSVGWAVGIAVGWNTTGKAVPLAANSTNDNRPYLGRFITSSTPAQSTTVTAGQILSILLVGGVARL